jgi:hypothetical protein
MQLVFDEICSIPYSWVWQVNYMIYETVENW